MQLTREQQATIDRFLNDVVLEPTDVSQLKGVLRGLANTPDTSCQYTVEIVETIIEHRMYEIGPCENGLEAAKEARVAWIDAGQEPDEGPSISVTEREFRVKRADSNNWVTFDESEVEDD